MMRKGVIVIFTAAVSATLAIQGCQKTKGVVPADHVKCDTVSYKKHVQPILTLSCAKGGCHDAATAVQGLVATDYFKVKQFVDNGKFRKRVVDGDPSFMPADKGKLPPKQLNTIICWLDKGAPEN